MPHSGLISLFASGTFSSSSHNNSLVLLFAQINYMNTKKTEGLVGWESI